MHDIPFDPLDSALNYLLDGSGDPPDPADPPGLRGFIYARRSIQDPRSYSIGRQVADGLAHCDRQGAVVVVDTDVFVDRHRSGAVLEGREGLAALRAAVRERSPDFVVVSSICRLARNLIDLLRICEEFACHGTAIHIAGHGVLSTAMLAVLGLHAQMERKAIKTRLTEGRREAAKDGLLFGTWSTYGYRLTGDERGWEIDEAQAAVIVRCFLDRDAGLSIMEIVRRLNAEHVPAPRGRLWAPATLWGGDGTGILQRKLLKGIFQWGRGKANCVEVAVPGLAIVEGDLFDRVNAEPPLAPRRSSETRAARPATIRPFRSVFCECGATMRQMWATEPRGLYCCSSVIRGGPCVRKASIRVGEVQRRGLLVLKDEILHPERRAGWDAVGRRERCRSDAARAAELTPLLARMQEIDAALAALDDEDDSECDPFLKLARGGRLELEHHDLARAAAKLKPQPLPDPIADDDAEVLRDAAACLLGRLPASAEWRQDDELAARLNRIIPRIVVSRDASAGATTMRFLVGLPLSMDGHVGDVDPGGPGWIERVYPDPMRGALAFPEAILEHHAAAERGAYAFSALEWTALEPVLLSSAPDGMDARLYGEALVFMASTGLLVAQLPERYAEFPATDHQIRKLEFWPVLVDALEACGSRFAHALDRRRFDPRR